ncbi:signal peptidase I [Nocardioides sp. GCM10027113]|uniref:signal peptidase I n=1 Tax=unclassified Nocardioides TaxID=2615069 RepID=UPI0036171D43
MTSEDRDQTAAVVTNDDAGSRSSRSRGRHGSDRKAGKKKHLPLWQETILLLGIALVLAVAIKALLVQAFYIPSESMEPGLVEDDRILVQKVSYWFDGTPQRGDVVVFKDPGGWLTPSESSGPTNPVASLMAKVGLYPQGGHLVKRVVGVAGDTITCCDKKGRLAVNGVPLQEEGYVKQERGVECRGPMRGDCNWEAGPIPDGHVFVMGDNRAHSADSTVHMCLDQETDCVPGDEFVPVDLVVGKVFVLLWPYDHFRWVERPDTFGDVAATD